MESVSGLSGRSSCLAVIGLIQVLPSGTCISQPRWIPAWEFWRWAEHVISSSSIWSPNSSRLVLQDVLWAGNSSPAFGPSKLLLVHFQKQYHLLLSGPPVMRQLMPTVFIVPAKTGSFWSMVPKWYQWVVDFEDTFQDKVGHFIWRQFSRRCGPSALSALTWSQELCDPTK